MGIREQLRATSVHGERSDGRKYESNACGRVNGSGVLLLDKIHGWV